MFLPVSLQFLILFLLIYCSSGACEPVAVVESSWVICMKNHANVRKTCIVCAGADSLLRELIF